MIKYANEYRIVGKKGCECFRSSFYDEVKTKLSELKNTKPNIDYKIQTRHCRYLGYVLEVDFYGRTAWSPWSV